MELFALNSDMQIIGKLNYLNLQWWRRYYEFGEFSVQIAAGDYSSDMEYVYTADRPETGMIQSVVLTTNAKGKFVQLSGFFLEHNLVDKPIYPVCTQSDVNIETAARYLVNNYKKYPTHDVSINKLFLSDAHSPLLGSTVSFSAVDEELGQYLFTLLKTQELSYRTHYDWNDDKVYFSVWQGKDRTQDQPDNSFVTFSDTFGNIENVKATIDKSNYKNNCKLVCVPASSEVVYEVGRNDVSVDSDLYKKIIVKDCRGEVYDSSKETLAQFQARIKEIGYETMDNYQIVNNVEFDVIPDKLEYMTDYDLGDKCDCIIEDIGISMTARIVEIYEVFKRNQHTITLTLGNKKQVAFRKARV